MSATPTAATRITSFIPARPKKTFAAAISPSMVCCSIPQTGKILDFVGGRDDLKAKLVRAIGEPERRFDEDKLRLVRAVRFAARFDYQIESATLAAIRKLAPRVRQVSAERLRDELTRLLTEGAARRAFELLDETGLLSPIAAGHRPNERRPAAPAIPPRRRRLDSHRLMLEQLTAGCPPTLAWGVLLHDVGKPPTFKLPSGPGDRIRFDGHVEIGAVMAKAICRDLRFSNDDTDQIESLVENHLRFKDVAQMKTSTLKRFVRLPRFEEHLELHRLDCLSSHRHLEAYEFVRRFLRRDSARAGSPHPAVTGEDLMEMGLVPARASRKSCEPSRMPNWTANWPIASEALAFVRGNYFP